MGKCKHYKMRKTLSSKISNDIFFINIKKDIFLNPWALLKDVPRGAEIKLFPNGSRKISVKGNFLPLAQSNKESMNVWKRCFCYNIKQGNKHRERGENNSKYNAITEYTETYENGHCTSESCLWLEWCRVEESPTAKGLFSLSALWILLIMPSTVE